MKKVICVDANHSVFLTENKKYSVLSETTYHYIIANDRGAEVSVLKEWFRPVPEQEFIATHRCNKCGFECGLIYVGETIQNGYVCTQPFAMRTSGICGGALLPIDTPKPEQEYQYGQEVEFDGEKGRFVAKSPSSSGDAVIIELYKGAGSYKLIYCSTTSIRPAQSMREKVIAELKQRGFSTYNYTLEGIADRIIELVKNEKI